MAKYSSDSDSDRSNSRHRKKYNRRSSSLDSSDSSSSRRKSKHSKSKRRYPSPSRNRDKDRSSSSKNYKRSRDNSRDKRKGGGRSRRSRSSSTERKSRRRSASREKSTSRSSSSLSSNVKVSNLDKAGTSLRDNFTTVPSRIKASVLEDINNEGFTPKAFVSSAKDKGRENQSKMKNVVIDMNTDTIHVPKIINSSEMANSIFHTTIIADKDAKFDRWVKKLYNLRQRAVNDIV